MSKIGFIKFHQKHLKRFNEIIRFRLIVLGYINILMSFLYPVMAQFYSLLKLTVNDIVIHSATIIAIFGIIKTFGEKTVKLISDKMSFSSIFVSIVILDILITIGIGFFYISPKYMIWIDMILSAIQFPFFIAYSNSLNNYINYFYPKDLTNFQNYRADLNAETRLLGLILSVILTFISIKIAVGVFVIGMISLSLWQLKYINMFKKYDFRYMINYYKSKKKIKEGNK